jgi:serine/threonine protein kinase
MPLAAGTRLGPYEVLGLIGAGGMGEVYKARDTRLDRTVAIKILPAGLSADPERRTARNQLERGFEKTSHVDKRPLAGPVAARQTRPHHGEGRRHDR